MPHRPLRCLPSTQPGVMTAAERRQAQTRRTKQHGALHYLTGDRRFRDRVKGHRLRSERVFLWTAVGLGETNTA